MLSRLFIAALWSPVGEGLTSWLSFVMFNCVFVTFPCGILGQVWYLIVSIPDLCHPYYFKTAKNIFLRTKTDDDRISFVKMRTKYNHIKRKAKSKFKGCEGKKISTWPNRTRKILEIYQKLLNKNCLSLIY